MPPWTTLEKYIASAAFALATLPADSFMGHAGTAFCVSVGVSATLDCIIAALKESRW